MSFVNHTDYLKFPSGRSVGKCRKDAKRLKQAGGQAFHIALDIVAKDNGRAEGWDKAISALLAESLWQTRTSRKLLSSEAISAIAKRHPTLTQYGLGLMWNDRGSLLGLTAEELLAREHAQLSWLLDQANLALAFVSLLVPQRDINSLSTRTSYELKHVAERVFGYVTPGIYIPHGAFIIAALFQGFLPQRCTPSSASVYFNINEQSPILQWDGQLDHPLATELVKRLDFYSR
jgi:hypothetical protein